MTTETLELLAAVTKSGTIHEPTCYRLRSSVDLVPLTQEAMDAHNHCSTCSDALGFLLAGPVEPSGVVLAIPTSLIRPGDNHRTRFEDDALDQLAASIKALGQVQAIAVRNHPDGVGFQLISGETRWRACIKHNIEKVDAIVYAADDARSDGMMLAENLIRSNLKPLDEARALKQRLVQVGSLDALRAELGKDRDWIENRLVLLELDPRIADAVDKGILPFGNSYLLKGLDLDRQWIFWNWYTGKGGTKDFWRIKEFCNRLRMDQDQKVMFDTDDIMKVEDYVADIDETIKPRPSRKELVDTLKALVEAASDLGDPAVIASREMLERL